MSSVHPPRSERGIIPAVSAFIFASVLGFAVRSADKAYGRQTEVARAPARVRGEPEERGGKPRGAQAGPTDIAPRGWWQVLKRTFAEVSNDRVMTVAGGVTFYGLLSLFPALTVLVSLYGLFAAPENISQQLESLGSVLPESAMSIIGDQAMRVARSDQGQLSLAGLAGGLVALWSANAAMKAMIDTLNIVYDTDEQRGFFKYNAVTMLFTLSAIVGVIVLFAVVAAVPVVLQFFWLGRTADFLVWAGRWPVVFGLVIVALAFLYRYGPCRPNVRLRWITPGSVLAAAGLLILSMLFSWYAANFGRFNETYGSLGAVIAFMTWMWLSAVIVLVGAELNAEIETQARPDEGPVAEDRPATSR